MRKILIFSIVLSLGFLFFSGINQASAISCPSVSYDGAYTVTQSCTFAGSVDGVENGNLTVDNSVTLTINAGQTVVWNPGSSVIINGAIAINKPGGQLRKSYLWAADADGDGYASSTISAPYVSLTAPVVNDLTLVRRSTLIATTSLDYDDRSASIYPGTLCATNAANISDTFSDLTKIASSTNLTIAGGQVKMPTQPWLSGYAYRKQLTVTGTTAGAQTNYQMKLRVEKGTDPVPGVIVVNGNCDSLTGWTVNNGAFAGATVIDAGTIKQTQSGSGSGYMYTYQTLSLTQGMTYSYSFIGVSENVDGATEASFRIGNAVDAVDVLAVNWGVTGAGTYSGTFVAGATNILTLRNAGAVGRIVQWNTIIITAPTTTTVYLDNHTSNWTGTVPNDIRFTRADGTTTLDYWIASSSASAADVWVEFNSIPASPSSIDFYIYYGNNDSSQQATGGTITYSGGYIIHTFTTSGTFTPNGAMNVEYLVVGGGGGGAGGIGGGGGAGGFRTGTGFAVTAQAYSITVGGGGNGGSGGGQGTAGAKGGDSIFSTITATGGGLGSFYLQTAGSGGSGGGVRQGTIGSGNTPSTSPSQGNNGGNSNNAVGGGGGGAGAVGYDGTTVGGNGGGGIVSSISGSPMTYAGGGGGSGYITSGFTAGTGGAGGGGNGTADTTTAGSGTANTGGGGGGGGYNGSTGVGGAGGNGGSGIVIIRYLSTVPPGSNGENTFLFFDDFNDNSLNTSKWTAISGGQGGGTITESSQYLQITVNSGYAGAGVVTANTYPKSGYAIDFKWKPKSNGVGCSIWDCGADLIQMRHQTNYREPTYYGYQNQYFVGLYPNWTIGSQSDLYGTAAVGVTDNLSQNTWYDMSLRISTTTIYYDLDNVYKGSNSIDATTWNNLGSNIRFEAYHSDYGGANINGLDEFRVRKYVSPEPAWGSFGSEMAVPASFSGTGTAVSTNLLVGVSNLASIDSITYTAPSIPSNTSITIQFSTNTTQWYDSARDPNFWDILTASSSSPALPLSSWNLSSANLYYKLVFLSNVATSSATLSNITLNYSVFSPCMMNTTSGACSFASNTQDPNDLCGTIGCGTGLCSGTSVACGAYTSGQHGCDTNYVCNIDGNCSLSCFINGTTCNTGSDCCSGNCYVDADGDRYAPTSGTKTCEVATQLTGTDCDDGNADKYPNHGGHDYTDGVDNNCDGEIDECASAPCISWRAGDNYGVWNGVDECDIYCEDGGHCVSGAWSQAECDADVPYCPCGQICTDWGCINWK